MHWSKPDFTEISLCGELTAYVNTDDLLAADERPAQSDLRRASADAAHERSV